MQIIRENNPKGDFDPENLRAFFIDHLNRIYCAKSHLVERLPELIEQVEFSDLRYALTETLEDVELQMVRMDAIYHLLDAEISVQDFNGMIGMVEEAFSSLIFHRANTAMRDLGILFYLYNIECMEMASFKILLILSAKFENELIKQLLRENFDDAKADGVLLLLILTKYMRN